MNPVEWTGVNIGLFSEDFCWPLWQRLYKVRFSADVPEQDSVLSLFQTWADGYFLFDVS